MTETQPAASDQPPKDLVGFLDFYLVKKAPFQIPDGGKEWLVQYGPWITIVLLVLMLPALLVALGIGTMLMPFAGVTYGTGFGIVAIGAVVQIGLTIAALPGLFARKMSGWNMLFYAEIVGVLTSLLSLNVLGAIISALIGFYILFQVRMKYTA